MVFNDDIMNDIGRVLDRSDIPFFCGNYLHEGNMRAACSDSFNMYPSDVEGDLKNFFLGVCDGKDPIKNALSHLLKWARMHSENRTRGGLFGVILTNKWDPKTFKELEDALSLAKNTMSLRIAVVLVTEYGASQIKVLV